jgi:hypothetical protein
MKPLVVTLVLVMTLLSVICLIVIRGGSMDDDKTGDFYAIPIFPGATNVERKVQVATSFGEEIVTFSTTQPAETVLAFYAEQLPLRGWGAPRRASDPVTFIFIRHGCPFYQFYVSIVADQPVTAVNMRQGFEPCR